MSVSEAHAISELHATGPLTQQGLADRLRLQKSTVSRLIDELCAGGLIARLENPADRRSVLLELTTLGAKRAKRLAVAREEMFGRLLDGLSAEERRMVIAGVDRLARAADGS